MRRLLLFFLFPFLLFTGTASRPVKESDELYAAFAKDVLLHQQFGRTVFYSWTTTKQIDSLRKDGPLLYKSQSDEGELSLYDLSLNDKKYNTDPVAELLRNPAFARKRYAWSNPWATCEALAPEYYGDQMLEIMLEDSAYICGFFPGEKIPFRVVRTTGEPVPLTELLANPDRIGAVYHVNSMNRKPPGSVKRKGTRMLPGKFFRPYFEPFREYIIVNERMVRQWSYGTPGVSDRIAKDAYKFIRLAEKKELHEIAPGYCGKNFTAAWNLAAGGTFAETCLLQGTAFTSEPLDAGTCSAVATAMRNAFAAQQLNYILKFPSRRYH